MTHKDDFREAVLHGLGQSSKSIPCRFLYDARGSDLFVEITKLDSYYPTRAEKDIFRAHAAEIGRVLPEGAHVVELGSGTSEKTPLFLEGLRDPASYTPVDIDDTALDQAVQLIRSRFRSLRVDPVHADFTGTFSLPPHISEPVIGFFPGSTVGNFPAAEAAAFLKGLRASLGQSSYLVIGADLIKDEGTLLQAYDDSEGVTEAFIKNILTRIQADLHGDLDPSGFAYRVEWDSQRSAVRMFLQSKGAQTITVADQTFELEPGERIHIEDSHKYSQSDMAALGASAGWFWKQAWQDPAGLFSVHLLHAV